MSDTLKPILFVAFGDPKNDRAAALPALDAEQKNICAALKDVWALGSWEYVSGLNCTRAELVEQFNSDRVTIFHFGGHASPQSLLLPAETEGNQVVNGVLLEDFLARQKSLKLAFFNACSTEHWAARLAESIPYVVATVCSVDDRMALDFASTFYAKLAADLTVEEAFAQASAAVVLQHEELKPQPKVAETDTVLGRFRRMSTEDDEDAVATFPWVLCRKPNLTRDDRAWSLSAGAKDPLIGLPLLDLAEYPLPDRPYVSIKGHSEADAPLFFGRRAETRSLYDWALSGTGSPPILLFYGQSGGGKSSLLNAGLLPRLKKRCAVEYRRRNVDLLEDFYSAIGGSSEEAIKAWITSDEPGLIILDQVEEAITHRTAAAGARDELTAFLARLAELFVNADTGQLRYPQSKARLILSFRKEYVPEIRTPLVSVLPGLVTDVWLERLDGERVAEVIEGPVRTAALRDKYRITLESGFAEYVASRLNDPNSPIATVLQIVLNKLWDEATKSGGDPNYTRALYDGLSALDNPLHGFYGEQLDRLYAMDGGAQYSDGVELDLLVEHTSDFGTSRRRTLAELKATYPNVAGLEQLIQKNKDLYLLAEPAREDGEETAEPATALTHDTLAPVIRRDFALSLTPGARARRLVENRAREWPDGKTGGPLDALDLRVVSKGLNDMRALDKNEQRMLAFSRKRMRRNLGVAAAIVAGIAAIGGGLALYERAQEEAQARTKDAIRLASEARAEATSNYDLAVLLSVAAYKTDPTPFEVRDAITAVYQARPEAIAFLHAKNPITYVQGGMAFSADGRLLAATNGNQAEVWDVGRKARLWSVKTAKDAQSDQPYVAFSADGHWLALADASMVQIRNAQTGELVQSALKGAPDKVDMIAFGQSYLVAGGCSVVQRWRVNDWSPIATLPAKDPGCLQEDQLTNLAVNPRNEREIALRWFSGKVTVGTTVLRPSDGTPREGADEGNYQLDYTADGRRLVATTRWGDLEVFDLATRHSTGLIPAIDKSRFTGVGLNGDGSRLVAMRDGSLGEWDTGSMAPVRPLLQGRWAALNKAVASPDFTKVAMRGLEGDLVLLDNEWGVGGMLPLSFKDLSEVTNAVVVAFSPDGKWIATGTTAGDVYLWDADTRKVVRTFAAANGEKFIVESVAFSPDSRMLSWPVAGSVMRRRIGVHAVQVPDGDNLPDFVAAADNNEMSVQGITFAQDGPLVGISDQGVLRIWDAQKRDTPRVLRDKASGGLSLSVAVSADGKFLAAPGTNGRVVTVLNMDSGEPVEPHIDLRGMWSYTVAMDPAAREGKGTLLAEGHPYGLSIWDYTTGKPVGSADMGNIVVRSVKFSPDGRRVAVGLGNGAIRMWDVAAGRWIAQDVTRTDDEGLDFGPSVAFSPDGRRMVWGGPHGSLREWDWDLDPDKWVERGCALAGRNLTPQEWKQHLPGRRFEKVCPNLPDDTTVH